MEIPSVEMRRSSIRAAAPLFWFALLLLSVGAVGCPPRAPALAGIDATIPWSAGRTTLIVDVVAGGGGIELRWAIAPRLELLASGAVPDVVDAGFKVLVLPDLHPLVVSLAATIRGVSMLSSLLLGPVRVDLGRTWAWPWSGMPSASAGRRWAIVSMSAHPHLGFVAGLVDEGERFGPIAGVRLFPGPTSRWWIDLMVRRSGAGASFGGTW